MPPVQPFVSSRGTNRSAVLPMWLANRSAVLPMFLADFTNLVSQMHLQDLAEADAVKEQVQQVQVSWLPIDVDVMA